MMKFEELDGITRGWMLKEFKIEEGSGNPYRSTILSSQGLQNFPSLMEEAIKSGDEVTLGKALSNPSYWVSSFLRRTKSGTTQVTVNPLDAAKRLGLTEFNTWYIRGLVRRLMGEGVEKCQIYRAEPAIQPRCMCKIYENQTFDVKKLYDGHRARYHPKPNPTAFSIPSGPNCHHTIRRIKN